MNMKNKYNDNITFVNVFIAVSCKLTTWRHLLLWWQIECLVLLWVLRVHGKPYFYFAFYGSKIWI
jgi:hypothetical protein